MHTRSVALLRGINVGTSKRVGMAELRALFEGLGATGVQTYLQSGNVVFSGTVSASAVEAAVSERFDVRPRVLVLSAAEFRAVAAEIPIRAIADDPSRGFVYFMQAVPASVSVPGGIEPEVFVVGELGAYHWSPEGASKSVLKPSFFRQLGPTATARNLRTVDALLAMLDA
jgi:uncharacterized protein (DUF1697 family)